MNNKKLGGLFEQEMCDILKNNGWWVHFCTPSYNGSQPCDIIACKDGGNMLIDCKTCKDRYFRIGRAEENQINAIKRFWRTGNKDAFFAVKHDDKIYFVPAELILEIGKVELKDEFLFR